MPGHYNTSLALPQADPLSGQVINFGQGGFSGSGTPINDAEMFRSLGQNPEGLAFSGGEFSPNLTDAGFDWQGALKGFGQVGQGLAGFAGLMNARDQSKFMKQQIKLAGANFNAARETSLANSASVNRVRAQMFGNAPGSAGFQKFQQDNQLNLPKSPL
jgi:hypothetical protein